MSSLLLGSCWFLDVDGDGDGDGDDEPDGSATGSMDDLNEIGLEMQQAMLTRHR